ncbi:hypothetical protein GGS23DRAFT_600519 [Durotheca rogersii]|uniref:uncharacterized protein n=1 Tax=Durotheca rogersii TaxID=419775 RepID=UPI00221FFD75|nr:uncharacterized protein GGS23DRAFT_600519 [Durotheca rogersii]KAI5859398.1 hypothetical protein GGS23DRAFT_600519 [Durotheca rogersii]
MNGMTDQAGEERRSFIQDLLQEHFRRKATAISRLGRDSNNFVYYVKLSSERIDSVSELLPLPTRSPGTIALPADVTEVVVRISNPEAMVNEEVRVQNEVAAMSLARQALAGYDQSLVPLVYAWSPSSGGRGWLVQEYKRGLQLDKAFGELDREKQQDLIGQIAQVYKRIQSYPLPDSVQGYGGLGFSPTTGDIITGPTTIPCGGPFACLDEMYSQMLRRQLDESDTSTLLQGWRADGLRDRLERFASDGIMGLVRANSLSCRTLIHGDFNLFNILYDAPSNQLTALLDYDFSHIASPAEEYFYSFRTIGALLTGPFEEGDEGRLRKCLLEGFEGNTGTEMHGRGRVNWEVALMTDYEFYRAGVLRPADIPGCGELASLKWFLEDVSPPYFYMSRWLAGRTPEILGGMREEIRSNLDKYLLRWGF